MHPSESAQLLRELHYDPDVQGPRVQPGSLEEAEALDRIDAARSRERAALGDTFEQRQRRASSWWGRGGRSRFEG